MSTSNSTQKGPDEIYCRSCGEAIKEEAEICPECGVRNEEANGSSTQQTSTSTVTHDPSQYETTVSDSWYKGVAVGFGLWIFAFIVAGALEPTGVAELIMGLIVIAAWAIMPIAVYFDAQYVRANSTWNPSTAIWVIAMIFWVVNVIAGGVYLYRRHETLGKP